MTNGWDESAEAWIADIGTDGDYARRYILDAPMIARIDGRGFQNAVDVGCGEGRFCRVLKKLGIRTLGIDPTAAFIQRARQLDPEGDYLIGAAEALAPADRSCDLVVSYLALIDIPDLPRAIAEMARVLRPGGTLLIANLNSFYTAGPPAGWERDERGNPRFFIDRYLEERMNWVAWRDIRIQNWHRPLSAYMSLLLNQGLELRYFSEPSPIGGDPEKAAHYNRVPGSLIMEWQKPGI